MANQSGDTYVMDVKKIREDARKHMSDGAVTPTATTSPPNSSARSRRPMARI